jgi:hypothetical protein
LNIGQTGGPQVGLGLAREIFGLQFNVTAFRIMLAGEIFTDTGTIALGTGNAPGYGAGARVGEGLNFEPLFLHCRFHSFRLSPIAAGLSTVWQPFFNMNKTLVNID